MELFLNGTPSRVKRVVVCRQLNRSAWVNCRRALPSKENRKKNPPLTVCRRNPPRLSTGSPLPRNNSRSLCSKIRYTELKTGITRWPATYRSNRLEVENCKDRLTIKLRRNRTAAANRRPEVSMGLGAEGLYQSLNTWHKGYSFYHMFRGHQGITEPWEW